MAPGVFGYWPFLVDELLYSIFSQTCVFFFCLLLPGWRSKLEDGICSAWLSPGVPSTERCFFSSPAREPSISICPRTTQALFFFFRLPPNATNAETKISFSCLLMLSCTLQAHRSFLLSQISVIVCVKEPHHHLHPY